MANFKIVVSDPKSKKGYQKEVEQKFSGLVGRKIREAVSGDTMGIPGYKLEITGGSDKEGFPMRSDVEGPVRKRLVLSSPPGFHPTRSGQRKRKSVRGNTISPDIVQVNLKVVEWGHKPLDDVFGVKPKEEKKETKHEIKPEHKEEKPESKAEHKEEKHPPKEHAKEEKKHAEEKPEKAEEAEKKMGVKTLEEVEEKAA